MLRCLPPAPHSSASALKRGPHRWKWGYVWPPCLWNRDLRDNASFVGNQAHLWVHPEFTVSYKLRTNQSHHDLPSLYLCYGIFNPKCKVHISSCQITVLFISALILKYYRLQPKLSSNFHSLFPEVDAFCKPNSVLFLYSNHSENRWTEWANPYPPPSINY